MLPRASIKYQSFLAHHQLWMQAYEVLRLTSEWLIWTLQGHSAIEQLAICANWHIPLQAATKLLLAEGSKVVMVASQSTYSQGIYGLVSNLGSLVVRTIFQVCPPMLLPQTQRLSISLEWMHDSLKLPMRMPVMSSRSCVINGDFAGKHHTCAVHVQPFEEAAFLAFSQREPGLSPEAASRKQAKELSIAVRCVSLVGECCAQPLNPCLLQSGPCKLS